MNIKTNSQKRTTDRVIVNTKFHDLQNVFNKIDFGGPEIVNKK